MDSYPASEYCLELESWLSSSSLDPYISLSHKYKLSLGQICFELENCEYELKTEGKYSEPVVLIGIYIAIASLVCILAMACDLLYGFRSRKFWFPSRCFSLNAASITVIAVAMKLPVDLSSPMPGVLDQVAKVGGLVFMCTMISNFMPSLASMDNKSLIANVSGLSILVITMIVNIFIQIKTRVVNPNIFHAFDYVFPLPSFMTMVAYIYMVVLLLLLIILISSAITIPTLKKILEFKYQATSKMLNDQYSQENITSDYVEKLKQLVKRYWIMAETSSPQFVMASNPLSSASGIICATSTVIYVCVVWRLASWDHFLSFRSMYKWSTPAIVLTQSIGIVVGSIAPIFRCFTLFSFKSSAIQNRKQLFVFNVEKYWTQKFCEWKESRISFLSGHHRSRAHLHNLKFCILSFFMGFQKVIVVSCKLIGLAPVVVITLVIHCSYCFKSLKAMFTPPTFSKSDDTDEDVSKYVLLLEDNVRLAEKTMKGISDSMNRLIQNAEKKQHNNLLNLLGNSVAFDGVGMFDIEQIQSLLSVELVNGWSLPIVSLTCIAISLPNVDEDSADNLFKSVSEGLLYTHLVEESLNKASEYVNIRRAAATVWHEVEYNCKWLDNTLKTSAYKGKTPTTIIKLLAHTAEEILNEFNRSIHGGELVEKENLPVKIIAANSMYRIAQTIMHKYERDNLEINENELFAQLSNMIADILAACLTNIPRVITMRCHENTIEKRVASVVVAVNLLGRSTEIIKRLETRELPNMDPDKMGSIDEWRLHLKQP